MVISMAIHTIELKMGTTQNEATSMMGDVRCCCDEVVRGVENVYIWQVSSNADGRVCYVSKVTRSLPRGEDLDSAWADQMYMDQGSSQKQ